MPQKGYWTRTHGSKGPKTSACALAPGNSWPRPETGSTERDPRIYSHEYKRGSYYAKKVDCKHLPADGRVTADALHRHGLSGLAGGADRRGGDRALPAGDERRAAGDDLRRQRHPLCRHAARGGGDRAQARRRRRRSDEPLRRLQSRLRRRGLRDTVFFCGTHRFFVDRRRKDRHEPAHTRLRSALHRALLRALGLLHGLRQNMEAFPGPSHRAAHLRMSGGGISLPRAGGGH